MASKFNFDDAIFAAARSANHGRSGSVPFGTGQQQLQPPFPAGGMHNNNNYHRSASANSLFGGIDDEASVGTLIARWGGTRREDPPAAGGRTAPTSANTTPRGEMHHAVPTAHGSFQQHSSSSSSYPMGSGFTSAPPPAATFQHQYGGNSNHSHGSFGGYADGATDADQLRRKLGHEEQRLALLEAEEAQLAAEERALQLQLRETSATHRRIDAALMSMQQDWSEVHAIERALRTEPIVDLSNDIAHAEGTVDALRQRFDEIAARHEVMEAQLRVVEQVEAHKAAQREELLALEQRFKRVAERRAAAIEQSRAQAELERRRERIVRDAVALLNRADAAAGTAASNTTATMTVNQPTSTDAGAMPGTVPLPPPALKGTRAALQQQQQQQQDMIVRQYREASAAAASAHQASRASSRAAPGGPSAPPSRLGSASCAAQARADSAVSFAVDMDEEDDEDAGCADAGGADCLDVFAGGPSVVFPSTSMVTGTKRNRMESMSSAAMLA